MSRHYALCERDDWMSPSDLMIRVGTVRDIAFDPCSPMNRKDWHCEYGCNGEIGVIPERETDDAYEGDGLKAEWARISRLLGGLVYVNPPYGGKRRVIDAWIEKCRTESALGAEIVGCVPASTGANWFRGIWGSAQAVCFPYGRLRFVKPETERPASQLRLFDGGEDDAAQEENNATFWSSIPYWGSSVERFYDAFDGYGHIVEPRRRPGRAEELLGQITSIVASFHEDMGAEPGGRI